MVLGNRLNTTNAVELARAEEQISKAKVKRLFESGFRYTAEREHFWRY